MSLGSATLGMVVLVIALVVPTYVIGLPIAYQYFGDGGVIVFLFTGYIIPFAGWWLLEQIIGHPL